MKRSITVKLILAFLLVSVSVVALASGITYWLTVREFKALVINQARDRFIADVGLYYQMNDTWDGVLQYVTLRNAFPQPSGPRPAPNQQPVNPNVGQNPSNSMRFVLADSSGEVLVPAGSYQVGEILSPTKLAQGTPVEVNNKQVGTVFAVGSTPPLGPLESQYLNRTNLALLYAAIVAALLALGLGAVLARTLTHPLRELTSAIRSMAKGELRQHINVKSKDELGELASAFNQMSSDLDSLILARRQMTADIAHDLRNPLTVIGGYIESMREGVLKATPERLDTIQVEVQHLQRLVEDLMTLSQADAGELGLNKIDTAPADLLERMKQSYSHQAALKNVSLQVVSPPGLPEVRMDPVRMAQVFGNLIANSLRYTPEGGKIILKAGLEAGKLAFSVEDNGTGIPEEALPHIFDRFFRADPARSHGSESGLGLAIARSIVEAHGGSISAESEAGKGTKIRMTFPG